MILFFTTAIKVVDGKAESYHSSKQLKISHIETNTFGNCETYSSSNLSLPTTSNRGNIGLNRSIKQFLFIRIMHARFRAFSSISLHPSPREASSL